MILFYWLVAIMPLDQHWLWGHELLPSFTIAKVLGILCLCVALFRMFIGEAPVERLFRTETRWFLAFAVCLCIAILQPTAMGMGTSAYFHVFSIIALFITVLVLVDSRPRLYLTLLTTIGATGFVSLYALRAQQKYAYTSDFVRPGGMFGDANEYALVVGVWMPIAFIWAISRRPRWERLFSFGCLLSCLVGTTFAASRGGFFGMVASFLYLVVRSRRPVRNLLVVTALMAPLLFASSASVVRRFTQPRLGDDQAKEARLIVWAAGMRMIQQHPLLGIGINNFKSVVAQYEVLDPDQREVVSVAHNTYIEIAAELGVPTLIVYLAVFIAIIRTLELARRRANAARLTHLTNIALGLQAGLIAYLVSSFFMSAWWEKLLWLAVFISMCLFGLTAGLHPRVRRHGTRDHAETRGDGATHETIVLATLSDVPQAHEP